MSGKLSVFSVFITTYFSKGNFAFTAGIMFVILFKANGYCTLEPFAGSGVLTSNGDGGKATEAGIYYPIGLTMKSNQMMIADFAGYKIRAVDMTSNIIQTFAGSGSGNADLGEGQQATSAGVQFSIWGLCSDPTGNVFFIDYAWRRVKKVAVNGILSVVAGVAQTMFGTSGDGGPATSAIFTVPYYCASDPSGNILVSDAGAHSIRKVYFPFVCFNIQL